MDAAEHFQPAGYLCLPQKIMAQKTLSLLFTVLFLITGGLSHACTIFIANDGERIWVGNNEDELYTKKYRMWYYPASDVHYGYMTWTELSKGRLFYGLMSKNPEGGLNEYGLFMDYTAIDEMPVEKSPGKKNRKKELVHDLLKACKTVDEALQYISRFNLIRLKSAQLFIADAGGNYAIVHGGYIVRRPGKNFALTNYSINNGHKEACYRRDIANTYLDNTTAFQLADIKNILSKTAQKPPQTLITNFSMAINLKERRIHLYYKTDFKTECLINLEEELKKGKHHSDLENYFPKDIAGIIEKEYEANGIQKALDLYRNLRSKHYAEYNFNNNSVENLAVKWIEKEKLTEAIQLLEMLNEFDQGNINYFTWLGVAYRQNNDPVKSSENFEKALAMNPNDYLATLWGKQENGKITFRVNEFQGAEEVFLMGPFTQWMKNAIKMTRKDDVWVCEAVLPKGKNIYKFRVNNENLTDKINTMFTGSGPDMFSVINVW